MAADWLFDSVVEYYYFNSRAVLNGATRLDRLDSTDQSVALATIEGALRRYVALCDDDLLKKLAISVSDDLCKTLADISMWSASVTKYIRSVYGTLFDRFSERGVTVRYVIDNTYPSGLDRPLRLYPMAYPLANVIYVCPHQVALQLAWKLGRFTDTIPQRPDQLGEEIVEGRYIAKLAARRAMEANRHLVYLEIDYETGDFDGVIPVESGANTIQIYRNQPAVAGSLIQVLSGQTT